MSQRSQSHVIPVEHLWQWLREDVTQHTCDRTRAELIERIYDVEQHIKADPHALEDRLWVIAGPKPDVQNLRAF